eukprot:3318031-Pyramimonas_sp.AAC.1
MCADECCTDVCGTDVMCADERGADVPVRRRFGASAQAGRSVQEGSDALIHQPKFKNTLPPHARILPHDYTPPEQLTELSKHRLAKAKGTLVGMTMPKPSVTTLELSVIGPGQLVRGPSKTA